MDIISYIFDLGVGKSSTVNHLFGMSNEVQFAKTSDRKSETRVTTEYEIIGEDEDTTGIKIGVVDSPGFNDTDGTAQDACNFYSIKSFFDK